MYNKEVDLFLYKYRAMNERNILALLEKQLWFSLGANFNDPFDCSLNVPLNFMTGSSMLEFVKSQTSASFFLEKGFVNEQQINDIVIKQLNEAQKLMEEGNVADHPMSPILNLVMASLHRSFVCCFSKNATNHLLWSHYADSHKGFCVRYNTEVLLRDVQPSTYGDVVYSDEALDLFSVLNSNINIANDIIFRKSKCWSYEDEVRCIHNGISEGVGDDFRISVHSNDAIDCIILGYNFDLDRLQELKEVVDTKRVLFKKIERSTDSYKLFVSPARL